jgi:uncharacterized protein YjiS (DUF1127 family)
MTIVPTGFGQRRAVIRDTSISRIEKRFVPLARLAALLRTWRKRATERGYLVASDHRLRLDLLTTGQEIESEVSKPFWRS